ncbi:MAG: hypothetical protein QXN08_00260 [Nitrososphaerales archaeon]
MQSSSFRDLDVALWVKDSGNALHYTVNLSAEVSSELGTPADIQVLNEAPFLFKFHAFTEGRLLFSNEEG